MARVVYAERALADLGRLTDFLLQAEPAAALETVDLVTEAVRVLENHPLIGRSAEQGLRELVISRGKSGYIALYSYELEQDTVLVLSVRHQREAGYVPE
ncbi:MAG: type II toxin-antitoxin system RelE/ParE family toxin [Sinimarinibacterium sp.]